MSVIKQVIQVLNLVGLPHTLITLASFLGSEEPSLKLLHSTELQCSILAQFLIVSIRNRPSLLFHRRNTLYIYISIYLSGELLIPEVEMITI